MELLRKIKDMYGSIDNMLTINNSDISLGYMYQIIKTKKNISLKVAKELCDMLELDTIEELLELMEE